MDYLQQVCHANNLQVIEKYGLGHVSGGVALVSSSQKRLLVIKTADSPRRVNELCMNWTGFLKLQRLGIGSFTPTIIQANFSPELSRGYLLMEYAGENFLSQVRAHEDPRLLYQQLAHELVRVYENSRRSYSVDLTRQFMMIQFGKVIDKISKYLRPYQSLQSHRRLNQIQRFIRRAPYPRTLCYSDMLMSPDDVYLTATGVQHSDLPNYVLGLPAVDLGCFASTARYEYRLPGSEQGFGILHKMAVTTLCDSLDMRVEVAESVFHLGVGIQCVLAAKSARTDGDKARYFLDLAESNFRRVE